MFKFFNKYYPIRNLVFFMLESILIFFSIYAIILFFYNGNLPVHDYRLNIWIRIFIVTFVLQGVLYYCSLYEFKYGFSLLELFLRIIQAIGITCIILSAIYFLYPPTILEQGIFFGGIVLLLFFLISWRILYQYLCQSGVWNEDIILIMDGELGLHIINEIKSNLDSGYNVKYIFIPPKREFNKEVLYDLSFKDAQIYQDINKLCEIALKNNINKIIFALEEKRGVSPINKLLECKTKGITIVDGITFFENLCGKVLVTKVVPSWLIFSEGFSRLKLKLLTKRLLDIIWSLFGLVIFSPLLILIALLVKLTSKGPVFFTQIRVGQWEKPYKIYKFRTMREDAEKDGAKWAQKDDPRITPIGNFLRRFRLDETPQFFNVLKGDMSFVGPRPERPEFVEQLKKKIPYYGERHCLKPGITGWAQVNYPYGASEEDALKKLEYDLFYVKNMTILFDIYIILKTIKTVITGEGAR